MTTSIACTTTLRRRDGSEIASGDESIRVLAETHKATLSRADLRYANLRYADLNADLSGADLRHANLRHADLNADLSGADLDDADLSGTALAPELHRDLRAFCRACPPLRTGGRIVYRTARSQHIGTTNYVPGKTYVAPVLSFSAETACHPGIYAGSPGWIKSQYSHSTLVRCYVRDGDWTICAKGCIRCKRLRVLGYVGEENG